MGHHALDQSLLDGQHRNPITEVDALAFIMGLHKMAEEQPAPDTTGAVEGPFLAPLPTVVELMAQMVSNEFKTQAYYVYYANMLRGLSHEGIAEEFMEHAGHEMEHANYLLRRMGVLSPGGVPIPPYPSPEPLADPQEIVQAMIVVEQMGLSLWKQLLSVMGENPMRYTIEEFLQREEEHQDELWQLVEAPTPGAAQPAPATEETPAPDQQPGTSTQVKVETGAPKTARDVVAEVARRKQAEVLMTERTMALRREADRLAKKDQSREEMNPQTPQQLEVLAPFVLKTTDNTAKPKDAKPAQPPTSALLTKFDQVTKKSAFGGPEIPPEEYVAQEQQLSAQQAMAEAAHAKTVAMQSAQAAQQAQAEAAAAQQQLAEVQQLLQQSQAEAQQNSMSTMQATQQAAEAEARAAEHSIGKMNLGMRVNQMRQELANFVMQDPVSETAATVSDLAAQGQPATPMQQQQADAAAQQQAMGGGEAPQPSAETQDQQSEAARAQDDASQQQQQADASAQKDEAKGSEGGGGGGKPGTHVTVKTSGLLAALEVRLGVPFGRR